MIWINLLNFIKNPSSVENNHENLPIALLHTLSRITITHANTLLSYLHHNITQAEKRKILRTIRRFDWFIERNLPSSHKKSSSIHVYNVLSYCSYTFAQSFHLVEIDSSAAFKYDLVISLHFYRDSYLIISYSWSIPNVSLSILFYFRRLTLLNNFPKIRPIKTNGLTFWVYILYGFF